jgi:hypothetical protein
MLARLDSTLPRGEHWRYEPKFDGFRGLLWRRSETSVQLLSRNMKDLRPGSPPGRVWVPIRRAGSSRTAHGVLAFTAAGLQPGPVTSVPLSYANTIGANLHNEGAIIAMHPVAPPTGTSEHPPAVTE